MLELRMSVCVCARAQLTQLILPSGKRFQFHYDNSSRLTSLVTPSHHRHEFQRVIMPRIDRLLYRPPHVKHPFIVDYDTRGRLLSVIYAQTQRRVTYDYLSDDGNFNVVSDWSHLRHRRKLDGDYTLQTSQVSHYDSNCSCLIECTDNVTSTSVQLTLTGCTHHPDVDDTALFVYTRDSQRRVTSLDAVVASYKLPTVKSRFSDKTGRMIEASPFTCQRHQSRRHCVSDDGHVNISRHYDDVSRLNKVTMSFNSHVVFNLQVHSDTLL